jgi:hypothetical protein
MLYFYQSSNPCICTPTPESPSCPDDCNCLKICNIAINALSDDAVGPCAATGTLDISDEMVYGHDTCACGADPVSWKIEDYDTEGFVTVSITEAGVLTWITQGPETAGNYYCVIVCVSCGNLKAYATITIGVKDLCTGCTGLDCDNCDPCTGIITGGSVDSSVKGSESPANPSIAGS